MVFGTCVNFNDFLNVVFNFSIYGLMIIDWNNFNNLVFYKIFLEIYISLNNSLMQARYFCPKIFLIFFEKICQSKNDQKNYWSSDFMYKTCPTIYFLTKILCSWGKWVPLKLPTTPSMVTDSSYVAGSSG